MKNLKYFLIHCFFFVIGCNAQKQFIENDIFCEFDQTISEKEKTFDIKKMSQSEQDTLNKYGQIELYNKKEKRERVFFINSRDTLITRMIDDKINNIYKVLKYDNKDGRLLISYFNYSLGDIPIGTAKFYNKSGEVIKVEDDDQSKNYPICFKEAMDIVEKKLPKKDTIFGIEREKKLIKEKDTLFYWQVYVDEINNKPSRTIWIYKVDAASGKIFEKVRSIPDVH